MPACLVWTVRIVCIGRIIRILIGFLIRGFRLPFACYRFPSCLFPVACFLLSASRVSAPGKETRAGYGTGCQTDKPPNHRICFFFFHRQGEILFQLVFRFNGGKLLHKAVPNEYRMLFAGFHVFQLGGTALQLIVSQHQAVSRSQLIRVFHLRLQPTAVYVAGGGNAGKPQLMGHAESGHLGFLPQSADKHLAAGLLRQLRLLGLEHHQHPLHSHAKAQSRQGISSHFFHQAVVPSSAA